jgi:Tetratricopeptide repeat
LTGDTDPDALNERGIDAFAAYQRTGQRALLDQAIALYRAALTATPEEHPDRAMYLSNLGNALLVMSECTGRLEFLEEAVVFGRTAVEAVFEDHPDFAALKFPRDHGQIDLMPPGCVLGGVVAVLRAG